MTRANTVSSSPSSLPSSPYADADVFEWIRRQNNPPKFDAQAASAAASLRRERRATLIAQNTLAAVLEREGIL